MERNGTTQKLETKEGKDSPGRKFDACKRIGWGKGRTLQSSGETSKKLRWAVQKKTKKGKREKRAYSPGKGTLTESRNSHKLSPFQREGKKKDEGAGIFPVTSGGVR